MSDFNCPYCNFAHDYPDKTDEQMDVVCESCNKWFCVSVELVPMCTVVRMDCMNGDAEHQWEDIDPSGRFYEKWLRCKCCEVEDRQGPKG